VDIPQLAEQKVRDLDGSVVRLGDEWAERPAVVVWLRHFGCIFCKEQAAELRAHQGEIEALGARLIFVGNGDVGFANQFVEAHCPGCRVLTDPDLGTYVEIGARRGWRSTLAPSAVRAGIRAFRRGHRQSRVEGVPDQQGAVLVLLPGDRLEYAYLSRAAGDHPRVSEILKALRRAPSRAGAGLRAAG
jgi:hypothetical protein